MSTSSQSGFTVAVIDDDDSVRTALLMNLQVEGFKTIAACDGEEGLRAIREGKPDLVVLDVMMPKKDGLQTCRELRNGGNSVPLILLTARSAEVDRVLGLELGADDYLAKPFSMPELMARIKALLRRTYTQEDVDTIQFANVVVDFRAYKAERDAQAIELSAREYRLLKYLVLKRGKVVTRDELLDQVWGYNSYPTTRTVDNHIARLRQKIESNLDEPKHILTVHGVGYKFVA